MRILFLATAPLAATLQAAGKPNILFIMTDDHAAHALGAYGGRLAGLDPTPNPGQLAAGGIRLTNAFVTNSIFFHGLPPDADGAVEGATQPGWELYDLREDPHEMNKLYGAAAYADVARKLKAELLQLKDEIGDTD